MSERSFDACSNRCGSRATGTRENKPGRDDELAILHDMTQCPIQLLGEMRSWSNFVF
jgi:hypothetical protein